jgi:hypothetical protein
VNILLDLLFFIPINVITFQFSGLFLKVQHAGVLPVTEAMGVLGLWTLMEPAGKPVPVKSLSHKLLAVDISIWLNQAVRGFRESRIMPSLTPTCWGSTTGSASCSSTGGSGSVIVVSSS